MKISFILFLLIGAWLGVNAQESELPIIEFLSNGSNVIEPTTNSTTLEIEIKATRSAEKYPLDFKLKVEEGGTANSDDFELKTDTTYQVKKNGDTVIAKLEIKFDKEIEKAETIIISIDAPDPENQNFTLNQNGKFYVVTIIDTTKLESKKKLPQLEFVLDNSTKYEPSDSPIKIPVEIKAIGESDSYPIKFKLQITENSTASKEDYKIDESPFLQINKDGSTATAWFTINNDDTPEFDETINIKLIKDDESNKNYEINSSKSIHTIKIIDVPESEMIRLTTGVDFDFTDNTNNASFYGELNGFMPNLFGDKFGVAFKIFSNRNTFTDTLHSDRTYYTPNGPLRIENDIEYLPISAAVVKPTSVNVSRNYGLSLMPLFKLFQNNGASLSISPEFEGIVSNQVSNFKFDTISIKFDTLNSLGIDQIPVGSLNPTGRSSIFNKNTFFRGSLALSLPFRYLNDNLDIRAIPAIYLNFKQFAYKVDLSVLDRNFGITIGAQLSYFPIDRFSEPFINIYIAKSFNFVNFAKFN